MARIGVLGAGYVGLVTSAVFASRGHEVVCGDIDKARVEQLQVGNVPIHEAGLGDLIAAGIKAGSLRFVVGSSEAAAEADFAFICLPTPSGAEGLADLSIVESVVGDLRSVLKRCAVVVTKSTVPVGTAESVKVWLGRDDVKVVSNPEFLKEGSAIADCIMPDRVVVGSENRRAAKAVAALYDGLPGERIITDARSAELIKYASNGFLAMKLSYVNAIDSLCHATGANSVAVLAGMKADPRIGAQWMTPGPGFGGSCFPKDVLALVAVAELAGVDFSLLRATLLMNEQRMDWVVSRIQEIVGELSGAAVGVWGLAFKARTDDVRESPALKIIDRLVACGASVRAYDPAASVADFAIPGGGSFEQVGSSTDAASGAAVVAVLTEWPHFREAAKSIEPHRLLDFRGVIGS